MIKTHKCLQTKKPSSPEQLLSTQLNSTLVTCIQALNNKTGREILQAKTTLEGESGLQTNKEEGSREHSARRDKAVQGTTKVTTWHADCKVAYCLAGIWTVSRNSDDCAGGLSSILKFP